MSRSILGIDLGGTNIRAAAVTTDREILGKFSCGAAAESGPSGVMEAIWKIQPTRLTKAIWSPRGDQAGESL